MSPFINSLNTEKVRAEKFLRSRYFRYASTQAQRSAGRSRGRGDRGTGAFSENQAIAFSFEKCGLGLIHFFRDDLHFIRGGQISANDDSAWVSKEFLVRENINQLEVKNFHDEQWLTRVGRG